MRYRIKQLSEKEFVPQVKASIFKKWGSIKYYHDSKTEPFYIFHYEERHCARNTYEKAEAVIKLHREWLKQREGYPIYYELIELS